MSVILSVVIPVYNVERYLPECLNSVLGQTLHDLEIICINDGSTDNSLSILRHYAKTDSRIIIINQNNAGYGAAMNRGLDNANGKYIGVVEPDDYIRQDMFEILCRTAERENADVVKGDYSSFTGEDLERVLQYVQIAPTKHYYNTLFDSTKTNALFYVHPTTWEGIYRREFLNSFQIRHNESPGASFQDNGFWFQVFAFAKRVYLIPEDFYRYRIDTPGSSTNSSSSTFRIFDEYKFIYEFLEKNPACKERLIYTYNFFRFDNYLARYTQVPGERLQDYVRQVRDEFQQAQEAGELDFSLFTPVFSRYLMPLLSDIGSPAKIQAPPFLELVWDEVSKRPVNGTLPPDSFLPASEINSLSAGILV